MGICGLFPSLSYVEKVEMARSKETFYFVNFQELKLSGKRNLNRENASIRMPVGSLQGIFLAGD